MKTICRSKINSSKIRDSPVPLGFIYGSSKLPLIILMTASQNFARDRGTVS